MGLRPAGAVQSVPSEGNRGAHMAGARGQGGAGPAAEARLWETALDSVSRGPGWRASAGL